MDTDGGKQRQNLNHNKTFLPPHSPFFPGTSSPLHSQLLPQEAQRMGMGGCGQSMTTPLPLLSPHTFPCSTLGLSHRMQSFRINLLEHELSMGHSSIREHPPAVVWCLPEAAVWISSLAWSSPWAARRYLLHCVLFTGYREIPAPPGYLHCLRRISAWFWLHLVHSLTSFHFKRSCNQGLKNVSYFVSGRSAVAGKCPLRNQRDGAAITACLPFISSSHAKTRHRRLL